MKFQEWSQQFSNLMNAGLAGGVHPAQIGWALELAKIDLANRQMINAMQQQAAKMSQTICDSQGNPQKPNGN